ncbi:MAG: hypothetical protein NTU80_06625 [Verrucomicrobia bacterium]|nr:hypothetical protein [Verrucomicrobiota bacterium]
MSALTSFIYRLLGCAFPRETPRPVWNLAASALLMLGLIIWSAPYFKISLDDLGFEPGVMHGVHLVIHEAGHAIPMIFGAPQTFVVFMGSGLQVLFPLGIAAAFYFKNRDAFGAAVCLWWAGHAALDVAPYIADARALELPLLGGGTGKEIEGHDWEYLLSHWHALKQDTRIAAQVALAGRLTMAAAFVWGLATLAFEAWFLNTPAETADEARD